MTLGRYLPNVDHELLTVPDPARELQLSLINIVQGSPPRNPWIDSFKAQPQGLWTGPTSLAYLFLRLSVTHPHLEVEGQSAIQWCHAYLDCGQKELRTAAGLNGWGVKNEYLAYNAVQAAVTGDSQYVSVLCTALDTGYDCPAVDNEHLSGRAGALALLRFVGNRVPSAAEVIKRSMRALIEAIMANLPWRFHGHDYIGAAHGRIGIITQIVLCEPHLAHDQVIEEQMSELLDLQTPDGHWYITPDPDLGDPDLVHYCHGSPGFVVSLLKIRGLFAQPMRDRIDVAVERGQREVWKMGLLRKEPNLCHGITGNMLALPTWDQRQHFLAHATADRIEMGLSEGSFLKGDDSYGLLWGEGGRAWGWMILDTKQELGYPSYTDD